MMEILTTTGAQEGLLNPRPRSADAVGDVHQSRKLLEFRVQCDRDGLPAVMMLLLLLGIMTGFVTCETRGTTRGDDRCQ